VLVGPTNGTLSGVAPNLTYRGTTNYFGPDSFTFSVNDGSLTSAVATATITLTNINDAPTAFDQSVTNGEDTSFAITLTGSDVDGPEANYVVLVGPTNGTLSGVAPNLTYRGTTNYFGPDSFTLSVNDGSLTSAVATVTITLTNINDAPIAFDQSVTNGEDTSFAITLTGSDVDGPQINYVVLVGPTNGTLSGTPPDLTYLGASNYFGPDSFTFSVNDGSLTSAVATVTILLTNINDAPMAFDQSVTNGEDTSFTITLVGSDEDGPETNYVVLASPTNGTLSGVAPNLTYRGASNYFGPDSFTFSVNDGSLTSAVATVSITVLAVNQPPVAKDDHYDLGGGATLDIPAPGVLSNDSDPEGGGLTAILVNGPLQGVVNLNPSGGFNYTPTNHFNGVDAFSYQVSDGQTNSGPATVSITVSNLIQILSVGLSNEVVAVTWSSIVGKAYRLQYKDGWADTNWTDLVPDVNASGNTAIGTNAVDATAQRIYRVKDLGQ
jgi:Bacterial Ig domain